MVMYVCGRAIKKVICFHRRGHQAYCKFSNNPYMIGFGVLQIFLSQIPNFHKLTLLSTIAAITSFGYAFIGSGLSISILVSGIIFTYSFPKSFPTLIQNCMVIFFQLSIYYKGILVLNRKRSNNQFIWNQNRTRTIWGR